MIRVSIIEYLNTVPLTWGLRQHGDRLQLSFTVPSQCAEQVAHGQADVGLIPSIEYARIPGLAVLAGPAIASRTQARSILLLTARPLGAIRTLAADTSSRATLALAELVLRCRYGNRVEMVPCAPEPASMLQQCDAAVLIGDPALRYWMCPLPGVRAVDLVTEWRAWTGLPFVFAFWAARQEVAEPELAQLFLEAREQGLAALPQIVPQEARRRGLPEALVREYLCQNLCYDMDAECQAGLERFYQLAAEQGLVAATPRLQWVPAERMASAAAWSSRWDKVR